MPACFLRFPPPFQPKLSQPKRSSGFSIDNIDKSVDPCVDFYQYACGNWIKTTELPADRPDMDAFGEVEERNLLVLKGILEKAAAGGTGRDATDQKIGDFYGACMDESAVDAKGIAPLKPELDRIASAKSKEALIGDIAHVQLIGPSPLLNVYSFSRSARLQHGDHLHRPGRDHPARP